MSKKEADEIRKLLSLKCGTYAPYLKPKPKEPDNDRWIIPVY
jgi:hypothetical protein